MKCLVLSTIIFVFTIFPSLAQIIHVPGDHSTIQRAIDAAEAGDTVLVDEGTYYENLEIYEKAIILGSQSLIDGDTSHISRTIINGSRPLDPEKGAVVMIKDAPNSNTAIVGFTLCGGKGVWDEWLTYGTFFLSGGILLKNCGATIRNNIIEKNIVDDTVAVCSAMYLELGESDTLILRDNIIRRNELHSGMAGNAAVTIEVAKKTFIRVFNNTISNNFNESSFIYKLHGGGMCLHGYYTGGADAEIYNNIISNNEMHCHYSCGGGMYVVYQKLDNDPIIPMQIKIFNNVISGNYSEDVGGGIGIWNMAIGLGQSSANPIEPVIYNNTIVNNRAASGSGIFNYNGNVAMFNNILWDSIYTAEGSEIFMDSLLYYPDWGWPVSKNYGIIHASNNIIRGGWEGLHTFEAAPLVDEQTFELSSESVGIGNGIDSVEVKGTWYHAPSFDLNGNARPNSIDSLMDIGAIESSYAYVPYFYLEDNGVTVKCDCQPGDTGSVNGILYEAVDRELLELRREQEVDLTVLCTSLVLEMDSLFYGKWDFNQDIGSWDVSNVTDMSYMFSGAHNFNQDIGAWDVSNVTDMSGMFSGFPYDGYAPVTTTNFNQDISSWNVSKVTDMSYMFSKAKDFNQDIGDWDMGQVTEMGDMFLKAYNFKQDIGDWDVSKVTNMSRMFLDADEFNQDIGDWNVDNVSNMKGMFMGASNFNQDLSGWCVGKIKTEPGDFAFGSSLPEEFYPVWGTCPSLMVEFEKDTIDLAFETKIKVKSTKKGVVYLVPENTEKDVDTIKNEAIVRKSLFTPIWYTITMDENMKMGTYWIYVVDDFSVVSDPDTLIVMNSTGIEKNSASTLKIWPNPAGDMIAIQLNDGTVLERLEVSDLSGRVVFTQNNIGTRSYKFNRENLKSGVYIVRVYADRIYTRKVIIR